MLNHKLKLSNLIWLHHQCVHKQYCERTFISRYSYC